MASKERILSTPLPLTDEQIKDFVYKGINLTPNKKDAIVNGKPITDSGIAEFILYTDLDDLNQMDATDIINKCVHIDEMSIKEHHIIFTANNFRTEKELTREKADSTDGRRPLAVCVDWSLNNGKLAANINYDDPLVHTGFSQKLKLLEALDKLDKLHPTDLTEEEFDSPSIFHF
ncbi:hypothetical protein JCM19046_3073 [Bacillus sp. JCM 19046]|nr:hypothetical protein JCM19046_3073 [Bacillus sp. JCM 19046]